MQTQVVQIIISAPHKRANMTFPHKFCRFVAQQEEENVEHCKSFERAVKTFHLISL